MDNILPFLRELEEANDNIIYHKDKETLMSLPPESIDDVQYIFLIRDMNKYAGTQLDQLIICDDSNWMVYIEQSERILRAKTMLSHSMVPEEFQVMEIEYPNGGINYGEEKREEKLNKFLDHMASINYVSQSYLQAIKRNILKGNKAYITMPRYNGRTQLKNHWDRIKGEFL